MLASHLEGTSKGYCQRGNMRGRERGTNLEELGIYGRDSPGQLTDGDFMGVDRSGKVDGVVTRPL